jgi:hypothetical protein
LARRVKQLSRRDQLVLRRERILHLAISGERSGIMKHDFGIRVAVEAAAAPHHHADLHALPVKWIFDPSFRYTPSYATDLRKTFERIRGELQSH